MSGGVTRPRPAWVPDDLYPFADRYADVAGCVVHYVDEGSGPPLLLLFICVGVPSQGAGS
jgi:hypothetical protein